MLTLAVPLGISTAGASTAVGTGLVTPVVLRGAELRAPEKPLASPGRERRAALSLDREPWSRHWWCGSPLWAGLWLMGPGTPRRLQGGQRTTALPCLDPASQLQLATHVPRTFHEHGNPRYPRRPSLTHGFEEARPGGERRRRRRQPARCAGSARGLIACPSLGGSLTTVQANPLGLVRPLPFLCRWRGRALELADIGAAFVPDALHALLLFAVTCLPTASRRKSLSRRELREQLNTPMSLTRVIRKPREPEEEKESSDEELFLRSKIRPGTLRRLASCTCPFPVPL